MHARRSMALQLRGQSVVRQGRRSRGAEAHCKEFPGSAVVPMAATGHDTIYTWECVGKEPRITASQKVDERGFIANQWRPLD